MSATRTLRRARTPGDVVAFEHFVQLADRFDKAGLELRLLDEHLDERRHVLAEPLGIEHRHVAADVPGALELSNPLVDRRRGQTDRSRDLRLRNLRVVL